jgi:two-component system alkaline phosphatase synthesis response regulator PhoP
MTKILVIEDEDMIRHNLVDLLEMADYDVVEAANGSQGIALAQSFQPDLVVCDIMMPDLSGYEVLEVIRKSSNPTTAVTPFIFLSARSESQSQRQGMEMGADDYLTKPCTPEALLNAIAARLEKHAIHGQRYELEREQMERFQHEAHLLQKRQGSHENVLHQLCQDLRDPLANMTMAIEMLKVAPTEEVRDRYLQIMQQECARQKALVNQLAQMHDALNPAQGRFLRGMKLSNSR